MNSGAPAAFLSYAHVDDVGCGGGITEFRKALEVEIRLHTGRSDIRIFQDRRDITWGNEWKARVDSELDTATFLVPVLTPSFFTSAECRRELQRFIDRERTLGHCNRILPVYWIEAAPLQKPVKGVPDDLAREVATREFADWRKLRHVRLTDPEASRALAELATDFRDALDRIGMPDDSAVAIRANVTRAIRCTLDEMRTTNPDAVGIVNLLVDAIRDSGRLTESRVHLLRWTCQSRLGQPPGALQESAAEPLGPDPAVDLAHADTFRTATSAVIDTAAGAVVSVRGDLSVAAALNGALREICALTGSADDGLDPALAEVRQEVDKRLNDLHATTELTRLAGAGASVIVSAMATPTWEWARPRLARLFASKGREEKTEGERLARYAAELTTSSEHDVQNRLRGFLEARLSDDPGLKGEFDAVVLEIRERLDPKPPTELPSRNPPGDAQESRIAWPALTTQEAVRKLETLDRSSAVLELNEMDPAAAARRLSYVDKARAADLLSHMGEELAAGLLTRMSARHAAELLALMEPPQVTAVLEGMDSDWVVARLSEMASDRALVLFSALDAKRVDDLLAAMHRDQAARLLGSVGKLLIAQARPWTTADTAEQEAKQIVAQARAEAEEILSKAQCQADEQEALDRSSAVMELDGMDPADAARRLADVDMARAADLLSHMDEELAATLLTRVSARHAAELLALMEPPQGAEVLEGMDSDWVVARLSEMASDRALVLFSALNSKRVDDILAAMQPQLAVRLLGSVGKVLEDQARLRTTVDTAEQEAKQIVARALAEAEEMLGRAQHKPMS